MEGHIFSTDLAEKLVWFVGLKNTIFCAHTPKEGVYLKVYGTVETQKGTKIQFSTIQLLVPFLVKSVRYRREPGRDASVHFSPARCVRYRRIQ